MSEPTFIKVQREFVRHLRDPDSVSPPASLAPERVAVYSNAVRSNLEGFIGDNFPRIKNVMSVAAWEAMVADYLRNHSSKSPLFVDLPTEFFDYLCEERDVADDPPYLLELAHFDLLENLVSTQEVRIDETGIDRSGDIMTGVPVMNPTTQMVGYTFPVHRIEDAEFPHDIPEVATFIVAFRDRENRYAYIDLNPATARSVELLLAQEDLTGEAVMRQVADELGHRDVEAVVAGGEEIIMRFVARDLILGTRI